MSWTRRQGRRGWEKEREREEGREERVFLSQREEERNVMKAGTNHVLGGRERRTRMDTIESEGKKKTVGRKFEDEWMTIRRVVFEK